MSIIAPMPLPLPRIEANSSGRSSSCSKSIVILSPPSPSGTLTLARQCVVVDDLEALDAGHQAGHAGGIADDRPDALARRLELLRALDVHALSTFTSARVAAGSCRIEKTRW